MKQNEELVIKQDGRVAQQDTAVVLVTQDRRKHLKEMVTARIRGITEGMTSETTRQMSVTEERRW